MVNTCVTSTSGTNPLHRGEDPHLCHESCTDRVSSVNYLSTIKILSNTNTDLLTRSLFCTDNKHIDVTVDRLKCLSTHRVAFLAHPTLAHVKDETRSKIKRRKKDGKNNNVET